MWNERAFASIAKSSRRVTRAADIQGALGDAFVLAVAGRPGPTHVEVTRDVLEGDPFDAPPATAAPPVSARVAPDLDRALARIRAACRPIIVAGKGAVLTALTDFWMKRFAGDSSIVGKQLRLDGKSVTVIGVVQPAPFFPGHVDALLNMVISEHHTSALMVQVRGSAADIPDVVTTIFSRT